jgi:hypothetical protein
LKKTNDSLITIDDEREVIVIDSRLFSTLYKYVVLEEFSEHASLITS